MQRPEPILTGDLFAPLHEELIALLRGLAREEWELPTAAGAWTVKDVAAHLLDTAIRRLAIQRDGYLRPGPFDPNGANRVWVEAAARLSPKLLVELLEEYGAQQAAFLSSLDPFADALWGVTWAGEEQSPMWFDLARELTERWHHQEQIRNAVGRPGLDRYRPVVIDAFVRALPHAYRGISAPAETTVVLRVDDASWSLVREKAWELYRGEAPAPTTQIELAGDVAWRLFTKGLRCEQVAATVTGDARLAEPVLSMVTVIG
jgi:uncharacterized protein (TIGR03083 family)